MTALPLLLLLLQLFVSTIQMQRLVKGNFHGALRSTGHQTWKTLLVMCMCESHVGLQGNEVCRPLVWMKRMSPLALRESSSIFLCFSVVLCIYRCVIHSRFLQSYLLLCNRLFSRRQTFLSKDTNVGSVVMDMLGIQLLSFAPCYWCGCFLFSFLLFLLVSPLFVLDKMMLTSALHVSEACFLYL